MKVKTENFQKGRRGEEVAKKYLQGKGYVWIESNFENKLGEVYLIMTDRDWLVFVEVKLKIGERYGIPEEMVTVIKLRQIRRIAESYLVMKPEISERFEKYRIDVVGVVLDDDREIKRINHYENVY